MKAKKQQNQIMHRPPITMEHPQLQLIVNKFQGESDRACAILSVATLDALLENLLRQAMITEPPETLFDNRGPLQSFSTKIDLAYAGGLISSDEKADLHLLRKIRNDFAHDIDHELSFAVPKIADRVSSLTSWKKLKEPVCDGEFDSPRSRFELCAVLLIILIRDVRSRDAKRPPSPRPIRNPTNANHKRGQASTSQASA